MEADPFTGAYLSVVESVAKFVAAGFEHQNAYLTFQEYFEKLRENPERWGKPARALLGALMAQVDLGVAAIGGKDSMSGSFEDIDVPSTLVSFCTGVGTLSRATSPEFKAAGHRVIEIAPAYDEAGLIPDAEDLLKAFTLVEKLIGEKKAVAVSTAGYGCASEPLFKM